MTDTTDRRPTLTRRWARGAGAAALAVLMALGASSGAQASVDPNDPLGQVLDPNQAQGEGQVVLGAGHVDFGPTLNTGEFILQAHDDTQVPSYWRQLQDVVVRVNDQAILAVPDDEDYAFLQQPAGTDVWVIPQTQAPGVVWMGWNTQEPQVMAGISGGMTLSIAGIQGPGDVVVFLNSGNFGAPQVLWDSSEPFPQDSWIEVNTHTHANWVFSEPGVYGIKLVAEAQSLAGETLRTENLLRVAVGDSTDPQEAFAFSYDDSADADPRAETESGAAPVETSEDGTAQLVTIVAIVVAVVLLGAVIVVVVSGRRAKQRALAARAERTANADAAEERA